VGRRKMILTFRCSGDIAKTRFEKKGHALLGDRIEGMEGEAANLPFQVEHNEFE
jgi:hypothetical protein